MSQVVLVLAHASDAGADSVAASVRSMLREDAAAMQAPVEVWSVRPETLSLAAWSHSVDAHGQAHTRVALPGRVALSSGQIRAVFNRIQHLPVPHLGHLAHLGDADAEDQEHAQAGFQALVLSWLAGCGERVLHSVRAQRSLVPQLPALHWMAAAARQGLSTSTWDMGVPVRSWDATVLVAGTQTTGVLARRLGAACLATAQDLVFSLLEFRFVWQGGSVVLVDVSPHPGLSDLEDIDSVAQCLVGLVGLVDATEPTAVAA